MPEKGISKYWTPENEAKFNKVLEDCDNFALFITVKGIRDLLKYDGRTKAGKKARSQRRLRLAIASDEELEELAQVQHRILKDQSVEEILTMLKQVRERIHKQGIKRSELEVR